MDSEQPFLLSYAYSDVDTSHLRQLVDCRPLQASIAAYGPELELTKLKFGCGERNPTVLGARCSSCVKQS